MKKTYLILGASSDLGISLLRYLCNDGESKIIVAHFHSSGEKIKELQEEYANVKIVSIQADLSDLNQTALLIEKIKEKRLEPTHIVSLTANTFRYTRLVEWDNTLVNRDMTIQVYSLAEVLKAFVPLMARNRYGKIVVMLTAYTYGVPPKNMSGYVTVKYALLGLMKSIASDYGDQGVNINGISPGMINTKFIDGIGRKIKEFTAQNNPKHRNLETADVIPALRLLLSDEAEFISGSNINLSGLSE